MSGQKRGWVIIAFDLLIVLGVYYLYSEYAFSRTSTTVLKQEAHYELKVRPSKNESVELEFSISNPQDESIEITLPRGITLQLSDGKKIVYWQKSVTNSSELTLAPGEKRTWTMSTSMPDNPPQTLYAGWVVDSDRQGQVEINA